MEDVIIVTICLVAVTVGLALAALLGTVVLGMWGVGPLAT